MPTGYTAGILDGTTKDFTQFAKICSRAFMVHLRDEPFNSEYKKREPSDYHIEKIKESKEILETVETLKDSTIIDNERSKLLKSIEYHRESIDSQKKNEIILNEFLVKAKDLKAPTEAHKGIVGFMVKQLKETIDFDCRDDNYYQKEIVKIEEKLIVLNVEDIRSELKTQAAEDFSYHTKEYEDELRRCRESNKWYDDFINSL